MKKTFLLLPIFLLFLAGCSKEETRTYMFWWNYSTSVNLTDDNVTTLYFYVNNEFIGTESAYTYWTGEPECGSTGAVEKTFTYTKKTDYIGKNILYEVKDQNGFLLAFDNINFSGSCYAVQLAY